MYSNFEQSGEMFLTVDCASFDKFTPNFVTEFKFSL